MEPGKQQIRRINHKIGNTIDQTAKNNPNTYNSQIKQDTASNKHKTSSIDSILPNPKTSNIINVDASYTEEVSGGMDWGCQEIATNVQDGPTKGGILPHVYA